MNGLKYAWDVVRAVLHARAHDLGLRYDKRFDCGGEAQGHGRYAVKLGYESPHSIALAAVPEKARVLDLGCAGGHVAALLETVKNCRVTAVDCAPLPEGVTVSEFREHDLNEGLPDAAMRDYQYVLMLDVIEHLANPERFVEQLYGAARRLRRFGSWSARGMSGSS